MRLGIEEAMALTLSLNELDWQRARGAQQRTQAAAVRQTAARKACVRQRRQLILSQDEAFEASKARDAPATGVRQRRQLILSQDEASEASKARDVPATVRLPKGRKERAAFYAALYARPPTARKTSEGTPRPPEAL